MSDSTIRFLYITCGDIAEAKGIARAVIEEKLAACANIMPHMQSVYRWEGKVVEEGVEVVLLLKTSAAHAGELTKRVAVLHSYKAPCIATLPVEQMNDAYAAWLTQNLK